MLCKLKKHVVHRKLKMFIKEALTAVEIAQLAKAHAVHVGGPDYLRHSWSSENHQKKSLSNKPEAAPECYWEWSKNNILIVLNKDIFCLKKLSKESVHSR